MAFGCVWEEKDHPFGANVFEQEHMPPLDTRKHPLPHDRNSFSPPKCLVHPSSWTEGQASGCAGGRLSVAYGLFLVVPVPCWCCRDRLAVLL